MASAMVYGQGSTDVPANRPRHPEVRRLPIASPRASSIMPRRGRRTMEHGRELRRMRSSWWLSLSSDCSLDPPSIRGTLRPRASDNGCSKPHESALPLEVLGEAGGSAVLASVATGRSDSLLPCRPVSIHGLVQPQPSCTLPLSPSISIATSSLPSLNSISPPSSPSPASSGRA